MDQQFEPPPLPLLVAAAVFGCFVALLGFVVARCCYRRVRRDRDCVEVLPTLSEEELEAACPPIARPRGFWRSCAGTVVPVRRAHVALVEAPRLARCVFHRPAGGSGRWPVEMEVSLDGVVTVQKLQSVLSSAYDALAEAGDAPMLCAPSAAGVCVEYRVARGHPRRRLLDDADLGVALSRVLHITSCGQVAVARGAREKRQRGSRGSLGAPSPGREWGRCAGATAKAAAVDDGCAAAAAADDDLLIDVSLSGCVGVRSTYGGLAISGEPLPPPRAAVAVAAAGHPASKRKLGGGGHTARCLRHLTCPSAARACETSTWPTPVGSVRR